MRPEEIFEVFWDENPTVLQDKDERIAVVGSNLLRYRAIFARVTLFSSFTHQKSG